jgi:hypothetical protein
MARITVNTTGSFPIVKIDTVTPLSANAITVPFVQDVTITNSTGVYSYTTLDSGAMAKLATPADNEISMNIVLDTSAYFGSGGNTAAGQGLSQLSIDKDPIYFEVYYSGNANGSHYTSGAGFITSLAPTVSPDAPVWVSPLTIAVDGSLTNSTV